MPLAAPGGRELLTNPALQPSSRPQTLRPDRQRDPTEQTAAHGGPKHTFQRAKKSPSPPIARGLCGSLIMYQTLSKIQDAINNRGSAKAERNAGRPAVHCSDAYLWAHVEQRRPADGQRPAPGISPDRSVQARTELRRLTQLNRRRRTARSAASATEPHLRFLLLRLLCRMKYFCACEATCVGVRLRTKCLLIPRQSPCRQIPVVAERGVRIPGARRAGSPHSHPWNHSGRRSMGKGSASATAGAKRPRPQHLAQLRQPGQEEPVLLLAPSHTWRAS